LWFDLLLQELPFQHLVRIVDCFLCEGRKVLYRVWIALLVLFQRHHSSIARTKTMNGSSFCFLFLIDSIFLCF